MISVEDGLPKIFDQVQNSVANHQKNVVALHKIHVEAAALTESVHGGRSIKLTGERLFEDTFIGLLYRVLVVKKGVPQADRVAKFVGAYVLYLNMLEPKKEDQDDDDDDDDEDDTTATRFTARLFKALLKGFVAKDKVVRYRCVRILAEMVSRLGEIDEDIYQVLREALIERVRDKETVIRVQAVVALCKLCGPEDISDAEDDEQTAMDVILDTLSCDPAAEVRRATLLNIPIVKHTLPAILARSRDTDTVMRRLVYSAMLGKNCQNKDGSMGALHPRVLTIAQRELIIRNGLGDREPAVRAAAGSLLGTWVDVVRGSTKDEGDNVNIMDDVLAFLNLFDLQENTVAEDALLSIFATRVDIFDHLEFKDPFWDTLTPEKAFLARVHVEHCIATDDQTKLEASIPVVTNLAFRIQSVYNKYQQDVEAYDHEDSEHIDDLFLDAEFIIAEMLKLAVNLDYADEIGRRKMFQLVRDMIGQKKLPEGLVARCLDVLRALSPSERDLIRVVVEVVHELRDDRDGEGEEGDSEKEKDIEGDNVEEEDPTSSATNVAKAPKPPKQLDPEEQARADALDVRCLSLCIGMLERVNGTFEENSTLEGILGELIVPAMKRKELLLREKGLACLGLCCLIARRMALNSLQLFITQVQSSPEVLRLRVLQIMFDMLMVHEVDFLGKGGPPGQNERIVEFLLHVLNTEDAEKVQAVMCVGLAKLVLAGMTSDERVLKSLVVTYLSPDTAENQELRQCLAYFFPIYCYSSSANQKRMREISIPIFEQLAAATRELDDDQEMVSPAQIIGMFVDWTDPQKAIEVQDQTIDDTVHLDLAEDILKILFRDDMEKEDKKALCQVLGRLYLPETVDDDKIRTLKLLVQNVFTRRPPRDVSARNALSKFDAAISKKYADKLSNFSEEEFRQLEQLEALFKFLDDIIPLDDIEEIEMSMKTRSRKRRSESVMTETTTSSGIEEVDVGRKDKGKGKAKEAKRRRVSRSDDDDDDDDDDNDDDDDELTEGRATPVPSRVLPKRGVAVRKVIPVQNIEDDEEEGEEETPAPKKQSRRARAPEPERVSTLTAVGNSTFDSIMDSEEEEEEEEVFSMVARETSNE